MYNHVHKIKRTDYLGIHIFQPQMLSAVQHCSALQVCCHWDNPNCYQHLQANNQLVVPVHVVTTCNSTVVAVY